MTAPPSAPVDSEQFWNWFWKKDPEKKGGQKGVQHWVPQLLLREFAVPGQGNIWWHERNAPLKRFPQSLNKKTAAKRHFYSPGVLTQETDPDRLEDQFERFETEAAPVFKKLSSNSTRPSATVTLTDNERIAAARLLGLQMVRTPRARTAIHHGWQDVAHFALLGREERLRRVRLSYADTRPNGEISQEEAAEISRLVAGGARVLPFTERAWLDRILGWMLNLTPRIVALNWMVLRAPSPMRPFVTSDHPVMVHDPNACLPGVTLFDRPNGLVIYPCTPHHALVAHGSGGTLTERGATDAEYTLINAATIYYAEECVFSNSETHDIWIRPILESGSIFDDSADVRQHLMNMLSPLQSLSWELSQLTHTRGEGA